MVPIWKGNMVKIEKETDFAEVDYWQNYYQPARIAFYTKNSSKENVGAEFALLM